MGGDYRASFYLEPTGGTPKAGSDLVWGWKETAPESGVFREEAAPGQVYVQGENAGTCEVGLYLQINCPDDCPGWPATNGYVEDRVKFTVLDLKLKEVTFSADPDSPVNYFSVAADTDASSYPVPHWRDADGDGDADDPAQGDHQSPVCFIRNTKMAATVKVGLGSPQHFDGVVKIRGDGPGDLNFPETVATVANGQATITEVKCANAFPDCVTCYVGPDTPLAISWEISRDGGASWIEVPPQSKNDAFITLAAPQCATNDGQCLTNTWAMFGTGTAPMNVKAWKDDATGYDRPLYYYHDYATGACSASGLLAAGNGQCHAWAELLKECLLANAIQNVMRTRVFPYAGYLGFGVKSIAFDDVGPMYPADAPWSYGISNRDGEGRELDDLDITVAGLAGQNMGTPHKKLFGQHFLVHRTGDSTYYDPSYGIATTGAGAYTPDPVDAWGYLLGGVLHYRKSASAPTVSVVFLPDETW